MGIIIIIDPVMMPAEPMPAIERPKINTDELGAAAQTTDPNSNTAMEQRNTHLKS